MFTVAHIETDQNVIVKRIVNVLRDEEGKVLLDSCPAGTLRTYTFNTASAAAAHMNVSLSAVYRQCRGN